MTYVRHRDRMVQQSVFEDLVNTLIALRWMEGTTSRPVVDPYAPTEGWQTVTTPADQVLKIVKGKPIQIVDYFPEMPEDGEAVVADRDSGQTAPNTLAMDDGQAGEPSPLELGSNAVEVPYRFSMAFWASSVATAQALLNDLRDRYQGRVVSGDFINLYDYNVDPETVVTRMEVDAFQYLRPAEEAAALFEVTMYYAQLTLTDVVDAQHALRA